MLKHKRRIFAACIGLFLLGYIVSVYWSLEPDIFDVKQHASDQANANGEELVVGYITTSTLIKVGSVLLEKPGGYLSNDKMPPSVLMDNMPAWEFGALEMTRDLSLAMRNEFSRSQSQSVEHAALAKAQPQFNINSKAWAFPSAESEYKKGINYIIKYRSEIADTSNTRSQFYARADNLKEWLKAIEKRLGSLSQRLSASVGKERINTDLAGDSNAKQATYAPKLSKVKTSWWLIDDVFYEAKGASWALLHFLKAIEYDFDDVLNKKNAKISLEQIIRELESTQETVWSPLVLNGDGFGLLANHSLVMANYISRANAAIIELNTLLEQG